MPLINVKTAFYLNEILFNLSINTKVFFMALDNKDIHLRTIAATFNVRALPGIASNSAEVEMYPRYQDSFLFYQNPQYLQNNPLLLSPPPHYNSHFLTDESRICNPSQPCFMAKQTGAYSQSETFSSSGGPQLPFNYTADPRTLLPTSSGKLSIPEPSTSSDIIHHPLPVYFRVKPALRTPSGKRCRKSRTVFTDLQLRVLEKTFSEQRYLDSTNRAKLSHILGLNEAQVKTWFQNRRMKWKKKVAKTGEKPDSSTTAKKAEKNDTAVERTSKETATNEREKTPK